MFLALLVLSLTAYAVQGVLVGHIARSHDLLWVATVRGLSLAVVMAPLALLVPAEAWSAAPALLPWLGFSCLLALLANLFQTYAMRHLPMAIANACCQGLSALFTLGLEVAWTGGLPPLDQLACVAGILAGVGWLGWITARDAPVLVTARPLRGVVACIAFGACMAGALIPLGMVSRGVDPMFAAWAWEGGIGLVGLLFAGVRAALVRGAPRIPWRVAGSVALRSSPTLVGTGAYTWATTMGSLAVAGGVLSMMMVGTAITARLLYGERLRAMQWWAIAATCAALLALGVVQWLAGR
jgi:hypothetical protein